MFTHLRPAVFLLLIFTATTGLAYPLAITGLAQVIAPSAANGSLLMRGDKVVGSALIAQSFTSERYFWPRPSAAGEKGYDAAGSSGSNLGPISKKLLERVETDVAALRKSGATVIPADAVTTSASGLDPHISRAFAELQIPRVAAARGVPPERIRAMIDMASAQPAPALLGERLTNVLRLNLLLDERLPGGSD